MYIYIHIKGKIYYSLTETKLKWDGEVLWCGANDIIDGVQEIERAGKKVGILLTMCGTVQ